MKYPEESRVSRIGVQIVGEKFERCGYIFREQPISDCGIDAQVEWVENGIATGELIALQIKSGSSFFSEESFEDFVYRGDRKHLDYWIRHSLPVLIVLCDVRTTRCYWQVIDPNSVEVTGQGWKVSLPKYQLVNCGMSGDLKYLLKKIKPEYPYSIIGTSDVSHGDAKRYSIEVLLNKECTQSEIVWVVKELTKEAANMEYSRSNLPSYKWKKVSAHVVWLFIFPTIEDAKKKNYICRSQWISTCFHPDIKYDDFVGDKIADGLVVDWSEDYHSNSINNRANSVSKSAYFRSIDDIIASVHPKVEVLLNLCEKENAESNICLAAEKVMKRDAKIIQDHYLASGDIGFAPIDCEGLNDSFHSLMAAIANLYLPYIYGNINDFRSNVSSHLRQMVPEVYSQYDRFLYEYGKSRR